jgi:hypothetical protein
MFQHAAHHTLAGGDVACHSDDEFAMRVAQGISSLSRKLVFFTILMSFLKMSTFQQGGFYRFCKDCRQVIAVSHCRFHRLSRIIFISICTNPRQSVRGGIAAFVGNFL